MHEFMNWNYKAAIEADWLTCWREDSVGIKRGNLRHGGSNIGNPNPVIPGQITTEFFSEWTVNSFITTEKSLLPARLNISNRIVGCPANSKSKMLSKQNGKWISNERSSESHNGFILVRFVSKNSWPESKEIGMFDNVCLSLVSFRRAEPTLDVDRPRWCGLSTLVNGRNQQRPLTTATT